MTGPIQVIIFDFDGVLVESNEIKTSAFRKLFQPLGPSVTKKAMAFHLRNEGLSRVHKIKYVHETLLGKPLGTRELAGWCRKYSRIVEDQVSRARPVAGLEGFLKKYAGQLPLFINSGTPEAELRRIVRRRKMNRHFRGVFGSPRTKVENIRRVLKFTGAPKNRVLMVGDARVDFEAAGKTGILFIGRVKPRRKSPFPAKTPVISDLKQLDREMSDLRC